MGILLIIVLTIAGFVVAWQLFKAAMKLAVVGTSQLMIAAIKPVGAALGCTVVAHIAIWSLLDNPNLYLFWQAGVAAVIALSVALVSTRPIARVAISILHGLVMGLVAVKSNHFPAHAGEIAWIILGASGLSVGFGALKAKAAYDAFLGGDQGGQATNQVVMQRQMSGPAPTTSIVDNLKAAVSQTSATLRAADGEVSKFVAKHQLDSALISLDAGPCPLPTEAEKENEAWVAGLKDKGDVAILVATENDRQKLADALGWSPVVPGPAIFGIRAIRYQNGEYVPDEEFETNFRIPHPQRLATALAGHTILTASKDTRRYVAKALMDSKVNGSVTSIEETLLPLINEPQDWVVAGRLGKPYVSIGEPSTVNFNLTLWYMSKLMEQISKEVHESQAYAAKDIETTCANSIEELLARLDSMTGLTGLKKFVHGLVDEYRLGVEREGPDFKLPGMHIKVIGNPGTGKTSMVRRFLVESLFLLGAVQDREMIETDRRGLCGQFIGESTQKTDELVQKAMGKVLFVDEAHNLYKPGDDKDFGPEAAKTLMKSMSDHKGKFVVIVAGYDKQMQKMLDGVDPGFNRRLTHSVVFDDFTPDQLFDICAKNLSKMKMKFAEDAEKVCRSVIKEMYLKRDETFGNAGLMETLASAFVSAQTVRLSGLPSRNRDDLYLVTKSDILQGWKGNGPAVPTLEDVMKRLEKTVGLAPLKRQLIKLAEYAKSAAQRREAGMDVKPINLHMIIQGPSGTGKTVMSRMIGDFLASIGLLTKPGCIEVSAKDLKAPGRSARLIADKVKEARNGVLLVDEAYELCSDEHDTEGLAAVTELLKQAEDNRSTTCIIMTGYVHKMAKLLSMNDGFRRRFEIMITLDDYTMPELTQIATDMIVSDGYALGDGAKDAIQKILSKRYKIKKAQNPDGWGNAGEARNLVDSIITAQSQRTNGNLDQVVALTVIADDVLATMDTTAADAERIARIRPIEEILADIETLPGQQLVKKEIRKFVNLMRRDMQRIANGDEITVPLMHMVFRGNPGTTKTVTARKIGELFLALGLLKRGHVVERSRPTITSKYKSETAQKVVEAFEAAVDGILFIDEIQGFLGGPDDSVMSEFHPAFIKCLQDYRDRVCVIIAGYDKGCDKFMEADPGYGRRFTRNIQFVNYSPEELLQIFDFLLPQKKMTISDLGRAAVANLLRKQWECLSECEGWGNIGEVEKLIDRINDNQAERLAESGIDANDKAAISRIEEDDVLAIPPPVRPEAQKSDNGSGEAAADIIKQVFGRMNSQD